MRFLSLYQMKVSGIGLAQIEQVIVTDEFKSTPMIFGPYHIGGTKNKNMTSAFHAKTMNLWPIIIMVNFLNVIKC